MYTVYAIYNAAHNKIYIGQTDEFDTRLKLHNEHQFVKSYTARFDGKWIVVYTELAEDRITALKRERQLKSFQGRQFIRTCIPK